MALWNIDPDHTVAAFSIGHMMIAKVKGQFNGASGTITFDPPDLTTVRAEIRFDASIMTTGITKRNEHLMSPDFFDVERFPEITFRSMAVEIVALDRCKVVGDLTVHGVTRPVELDAKYLGPVKSPFGETSIGIAARTRVNREDFGMTWNVEMDNNGFMVGKEVDIELHVEADLQGEGT